MFEEHCGLETAYQPGRTVKVAGVQWLDAANLQACTVQCNRAVLAHPIQKMSAGAIRCHIVFGVYFKNPRSGRVLSAA
jgi:hypothetical protein